MYNTDIDFFLWDMVSIRNSVYLRLYILEGDIERMLNELGLQGEGLRSNHISPTLGLYLLCAENNCYLLESNLAP